MNSQKVAIVVDSCADLDADTIGDEPIWVLPLRIRTSQGEFRDGVDITSQDIYRIQKAEMPQTTLPAGADFGTIMDGLWADGYERVICLALTSKVSGCCNMMRLAAEQYQKLDIRVYDSCSGSMGTGMMALYLCRCIRAGYSWQQLLNMVDWLTRHTWVFFAADTLEFLQKGGRISRITAVAGSMLSIKPIVSVDSEGYLASVAKVRGHKQIIPGLLKQIKQHYRPGCRFLLGMVTGGADPTDRVLLRQQLTTHLPNFDAFYEGFMGGVLSTYLGPRLLGAGIICLPDCRL